MLEPDRGALLAHGYGRLEDDEHLGNALQRERLDAGGDGAEPLDQGGAAVATVASVSANGSDMPRI